VTYKDVTLVYNYSFGKDVLGAEEVTAGLKLKEDVVCTIWPEGKPHENVLLSQWKPLSGTRYRLQEKKKLDKNNAVRLIITLLLRVTQLWKKVERPDDSGDETTSLIN